MAVSEKSLGKESTAPGPVPEGVIRLYSMRFCPFAQRTRLVLLTKGIKFETVNVNLKSKPEWFLKKSPFGMVPVLETSKGEIIYESEITCDYLDEAYPGMKLTPSDPFQKAQEKMVLEHFTKLLPFFYNVFHAIRRGEDPSELKAEFNTKVLELEKILVNKKTPYFGGELLSMIDYMIWPWFERVECFKVHDCLKNTPNINSWIETMKQDPAVKATITDVDTLINVIKLFHADDPHVCDYGL